MTIRLREWGPRRAAVYGILVGAAFAAYYHAAGVGYQGVGALVGLFGLTFLIVAKVRNRLLETRWYSDPNENGPIRWKPALLRAVCYGALFGLGCFPFVTLAFGDKLNDFPANMSPYAIASALRELLGLMAIFIVASVFNTIYQILGIQPNREDSRNRSESVVDAGAEGD